jgi:hypothetical protein
MGAGWLPLTTGEQEFATNFQEIFPHAIIFRDGCTPPVSSPRFVGDADKQSRNLALLFARFNGKGFGPPILMCEFNGHMRPVQMPFVDYGSASERLCTSMHTTVDNLPNSQKKTEETKAAAQSSATMSSSVDEGEFTDISRDPPFS